MGCRANGPDPRWDSPDTARTVSDQAPGIMRKLALELTGATTTPQATRGRLNARSARCTVVVVAPRAAHGV